MQVLEGPHERPDLKPALDHRAQGKGDLALELLGVEVLEAEIARVDAEQIAQARRDARDIVLVGANALEARDELVLGHHEGVVRRHAVGVAHGARQHPVRLLAERGALNPAHCHALEPALGLEPRQELGEQPRLARAGLADQAHDLGLATGRALERGHHLAELVLAADERCLEAERLEPARRSRRIEGAEQPMGGQRPRSTLQRELPERVEGEGVAGQPVGHRADHDVSGLGRRLQPGGGVHRIAGDRIGAGAARALAAGNDRARVDADMERQRLAEAALPALAHRGDALAHGKRGAEGALGVVLVGDGGAEQGEQRIADELVDEAIEAFDRDRELGDHVVLQGADFLGIEAFAQAREAAQIGEQNGHRAPVGLLSRRAARRPPGRRPRLGDDGRCGRGRRAWRGAEPCAAFRAEGEVGRRIKAAAGALHTAVPVVSSARSMAARDRPWRKLIAVSGARQPRPGRLPTRLSCVKSEWG